MRYFLYILFAIVVIGVGFLVFKFLVPKDLTKDFDLVDNSNNSVLRQAQDDDVNSVNIDKEVMITDGIKHLVPLEDIIGGGPPKDGIPSIDNPTFVTVQEADKYLSDDKLGIAVEKDGVWRFYPFQILVWHEIVNDVFNGEHLLVTYCPLCGTGIVFIPLVDGEFVEFGTSGRLYNSNLVMYDRKTDSLWQQQGGRAIVGTAVGQKLNVRAADNILWGDFKKAHPQAEVLSRDTGVFRDYTRDPYESYYTSRRVIFPVGYTDNRLHEKAVVYGVAIDGNTKAYTEDAITREQIINDLFAGTDILVIRNLETKAIRFFNRSVKNTPLMFELKNGILTDEQTKSKWNFYGMAVDGHYTGTQLERINPEFGFWFSWVAFNPDTELYN